MSRESALAGHVRLAGGDVRLESGDRLTVFSAPAARVALESLLGSEIDDEGANA